MAVWALIEGTGGTVLEDTSWLVVAYPEVLDTDAFGAGIFFHFLVPALVLMLAGGILAGRHKKSGATDNPIDTVIAGLTLSIWFALLLVVAALVVTDDGLDIDVAEVLLMGFSYALVFTAIGATIRSGTRLFSGRGFLAGIGAFLVGLAGWFFLEDPFDDIFGVDSFGDLEGTLAHVSFLNDYVHEYGLEAGELLPEWFAIVMPLLFGAIVGYVASRSDLRTGLGEGARLAGGYFLLVFLIALAYVAATVRDLQRADGGWTDQQIVMVSSLVGIFPRTVLLAGVVYPVLFASIGGVIGVAVYRETQGNASGQPQSQSGGPGHHEPHSGDAGKQEPHSGDAGQEESSGDPDQQEAGSGQNTTAETEPVESESEPPGTDTGADETANELSPRDIVDEDERE